MCVGINGKKSVCSIAMRAHQRDAWADACDCSCAAASEGIENGGWFKKRRIRAECRAICIPACDQPHRVTKSEFELNVQ